MLWPSVRGNFLKNPNSVVARYYPSGDLLNSQRTGGSSFIWSGLWAAKEELKKDFGWVVGDGRQINVFTNPWLNGKQNFMVKQGAYNINSSTKVACFLELNTKKWDVSKIRETFEEIDRCAFSGVEY